MSDYISREEVLEFIRGYRHSTDVAFHMEKHLNEIPAADVRLVVHGKWKLEDDGALFYRCSVCGKAMHGWFAEIYIGDGHYCPNCGADMRESKQESKQVGILEGES